MYIAIYSIIWASHNVLNFASQSAVTLAPISDEPAANVNMRYSHAHSKEVGFLHWLMDHDIVQCSGKCT